MDGICYHFHAQKRAYGSPSQEEIRPLVELSRYLLQCGFSFCRAVTSGGVNEISHSGDAAYDVCYRKLSDFSSNFVSDFHQAQRSECERTGGWISSLNYKYVEVYLKRDRLLVHARVSPTFSVFWYGADEEDALLLDAVNRQMGNRLAPCTVSEPRHCTCARLTPWE